MPRNSIDAVRHSLAHLLGAAVLELYPGSKLAIGPSIDDGFYYDIDVRGKISDTDLPRIETEMRKILKTWDKFEEIKETAQSAKKRYVGNAFKLELIEELAQKKEKITSYQSGKFIDLCRGGHVEKASDIKPDSFKLSRVAGAYWRGDEKNPQPELDLFTFSDLVGPGLPLWTPKGTLLRNILDDFVWSLRKQHDYQQVDIPHITKKELYEKSGHWDKFQDELFKITTREGHLFAMKPMNCPHHTQIYARKPHSYRELPQRYANTTKDYRDEQTGELSGLSRVRAFTQDDAHVFCRMNQVKEEFLKVWDIVHEFYKSFGFELKVRLSRHDPEHMEKYLGEEKKWQSAEKILNEIIKEKKVRAIDGLGEAAFYGPKLDFLAKDSIGREWQVATIQLDMNMPERFDLSCINEKGEKERIVMIHAAIMGSIERFISIAIEHYAGAFPLWLSPVQVAILPISENQNKWSESIAEELRSEGIRVEINFDNETLGKKIRQAELQKIPYLLIIGEKEVGAKTVSVRQRSNGDLGQMTIDKLKDRLKSEVISKK
ncbi:MAG: Threonine-tRNA ligase [Candidatus Yanofskybacteria bacterium GW2011_GWA2_44_9]|uniref:Threonine--tRNA ligase n=1 Tax=Candidatus Yanofskybacteria bacterium GW2011_GWA2_44_9 TaxID=1619025 RepID=A0A0G1KB76_9BACT|nr:MAG: Threonine-tRNA ligase [Candidatus Yanofskybacteria bacterium GW2011_GWA2_44_9]